ncbi:hypothetical protein B0H10DRAFT_2432402 [Mycena sp. CBHHK59/15]|nr:hypothetical protein B0H10DRAFT_2432402 [Mycena sp. CBHHK59/15]
MEKPYETQNHSFAQIAANVGKRSSRITQVTAGCPDGMRPPCINSPRIMWWTSFFRRGQAPSRERVGLAHAQSVCLSVNVVVAAHVADNARPAAPRGLPRPPDVHSPVPRIPRLQSAPLPPPAAPLPPVPGPSRISDTDTLLFLASTPSRSRRSSKLSLNRDAPNRDSFTSTRDSLLSVSTSSQRSSPRTPDSAAQSLHRPSLAFSIDEEHPDAELDDDLLSKAPMVLGPEEDLALDVPPPRRESIALNALDMPTAIADSDTEPDFDTLQANTPDDSRAPSPDITTILATTPRPRIASLSASQRSRSHSRTTVDLSYGSVYSVASKTRAYAFGYPDVDASLDPHSGDEDDGQVWDGDGGDSDSSLDLHTSLPELMVRHGLLSPRSKLLPSPASTSALAPLSAASVDSSFSALQDASSPLPRDTRDTPKRRRSASRRQAATWRHRSHHRARLERQRRRRRAVGPDPPHLVPQPLAPSVHRVLAAWPLFRRLLLALPPLALRLHLHFGLLARLDVRKRWRLPAPAFARALGLGGRCGRVRRVYLETQKLGPADVVGGRATAPRRERVSRAQALGAYTEPELTRPAADHSHALGGVYRRPSVMRSRSRVLRVMMADKEKPLPRPPSLRRNPSMTLGASPGAVAAEAGTPSPRTSGIARPRAFSTTQLTRAAAPPPTSAPGTEPPKPQMRPLRLQPQPRQPVLGGDRAPVPVPSLASSTSSSSSLSTSTSASTALSASTSASSTYAYVHASPPATPTTPLYDAAATVTTGGARLTLPRPRPRTGTGMVYRTSTYVPGTPGRLRPPGKPIAL